MKITLEQMAAELTEAGWHSWDQLITLWQSPEGDIFFGARQAWEIMAHERASRFDA